MRCVEPMNSHLPVGRLAAFLDILPRETVWLAIVTATAAIYTLDHHFPAADFTPLYMPVICGACWGLGAREGYLVALVSAVLAVTATLQASATLPSGIVGLRIAIRMVSYLFIAPSPAFGAPMTVSCFTLIATE